VFTARLVGVGDASGVSVATGVGEGWGVSVSAGRGVKVGLGVRLGVGVGGLDHRDEGAGVASEKYQGGHCQAD